MSASTKPRKTTLRVATALASMGVIGFALVGCSPDEEATNQKGTTPPVVPGASLPAGAVDNADHIPTGQLATAAIKNEAGDVVGRATFTAENPNSPVTITVKVTGGDIAPGFHGMHLHAKGVCEPGTDGAAFGAAGSHLQAEGHTGHPSSGDLISINILADHTGLTTTVTDSVKLADVFGKAIVIHEKPDNFGNIPTEYAPKPNQKTLDTGDAGARVACGVIREGE
ncbi:superoxide dismutase family protein [Gordonia sp. ABSL1-1]|uniref:superoxide dismutase family protein n=1 Tax=Gordonia sp. ABSL1-1 TaxID=3053923 RepID=UPI002572661D|nr:superoxide dismutase family protein [Gordonia sp. ABSL1-1]MDL9936996.1 superoxide dismutase family protein [Gordonia sp. ABSL1-1]